MPRYVTTAQVARALGLADSTIRHYRAAGRIAPRSQTPGGHARYDLDEVVEALGVAGRPAPGEQEAWITGRVKEGFAPLGRHDVRSSGRSGVLPAEMVALGTREVTERAPAAAPGRPRWGGTLINAQSRAHA
jgi:cytochrome c5